MADEKDYKKMVEDREAELQTLFTRMEEDEDQYYLAEYKMKYQDNQEVPASKIHNVTLNDPALYAYRAIAILAAAFRQTLVEGKGLSDADTSYVEEFIEYLLYGTDQELGNLGLVGLFPYEVEQFCIRGRGCVRYTMLRAGDQLIPRLVPWDTRYVAYRNDLKGLKWASYRTHRSNEDIAAEYPEWEDRLTGDHSTVLDLWTRKRNMTWVEENEVRNKAHPYGEVPVIYQLCPAGSMLAGSNAISHSGESIFALDRGIWPELNKATTVLQTLNMMSFLTPLQYESEAGEQATLPDKPPYGVGVVTAVEKGGGFKAMPTEDMRNATRHLLAILEGRAQRGSLPSVDYGNLTFPLSAVAIARLTESKDQIFVPRLQGLAMFYQRLARMMIRQFIEKGMEGEFGEEGHRKSFSPAKLKGAYTITFRYYSQSPEQQIANFAVGSAAYNIGYSQHTIFRDIIKNPNPDAEILKRKTEDAEALDPILKLHNTVLALIDAKRFFEAKILADTVVGMIRQRRMPAQSPQPETVKGAGNGQRQLTEASQLVPLLGAGGGGGRRLGAQELEPSEQEERSQEKRQQMAETNRTRREAERG